MSTHNIHTVKPSLWKQSQRNWWHIDAKNRIVGRLASEIAQILQGKHKPTYSKSQALGDYVVVTNASQIVFTGKKWEQKYYKWHTGYPGLKKIKALDLLKKFPDRILRRAIWGMLPPTKIREELNHRLRIFNWEEHLHQAQLAHSAPLPHITFEDSLYEEEEQEVDPRKYTHYIVDLEHLPDYSVKLTGYVYKTPFHARYKTKPIFRPYIEKPKDYDPKKQTQRRVTRNSP